MSTQFSAERVEKITQAMSDTNTFAAMKVDDFMAMWVK
jgi:2-methylcitrate dehydratase